MPKPKRRKRWGGLKVWRHWRHDYKPSGELDAARLADPPFTGTLAGHRVMGTFRETVDDQGIAHLDGYARSARLAPLPISKLGNYELTLDREDGMMVRVGSIVFPSETDQPAYVLWRTH